MTSDKFLDDPVGGYAEMRATCPVVWSEADQEWIVTTAKAAKEVLIDTGKFSNQAYNRPERNPLLVLAQDPPEHAPYRRLLMSYFTPAATAGLQPKLEAYSEELLDRYTERGSLDLIFDYGNPLPALIVLEQCGLPTEQWWKYAEPNHAIFYEPPGSEGFKRAQQGLAWMSEQLHQVVVDRRSNPGEDLISHLATATVDDELLPVSDIVGILNTVIGGGVDTTTSLYANALHWLHGHHEERRQLIEALDGIPTATEEFLRYFAPAPNLRRMVVGGDCVVAGQQLAEGERLSVSAAAANFDEEVFPSAQEFDLGRPGNRHMSFGLGIHRCLGSHLARAMLHVMLRHTLERMPDFEVDTASARPYRSHIVNGWVSMPVTFTPTAKRATTSILPPTE